MFNFKLSQLCMYVLKSTEGCNCFHHVSCIFSTGIWPLVKSIMNHHKSGKSEIIWIHQAAASQFHWQSPFWTFLKLYISFFINHRLFSIYISQQTLNSFWLDNGNWISWTSKRCRFLTLIFLIWNYIFHSILHPNV